MADFDPIVAVVGVGVTGREVARHLGARGVRLVLHDTRAAVAAQVAAAAGGVVVDTFSDVAGADLVVLCSPDPHADLVDALVGQSVPVMSVSDDLDDIDQLFHVDQRAELHGVPVVVGAGMSPGLSGLLARSLAGQFDAVEEIHVAVHGTGGPSCARHHHRSLGRRSVAWHDGEWVERLGGSGRELCWFPEPIGAHDCYRADLADPRVLHRCFPEAQRVSARLSATRRDRLTARLPMLTPPHTGGSVGAVRVEVRGADSSGARHTAITGTAGRAGAIAAAVATAAALTALSGRLDPGVRMLGDGTHDAAAVLDLVQDLGVVVQEFTGVARATSW